MKVRKKRIFIALGVLLVIVGALAIWLNIPYSPVKKQYQNDITALLAENQLSVNNELFKEKTFHICRPLFNDILKTAVI